MKFQDKIPVSDDYWEDIKFAAEVYGLTEENMKVEIKRFFEKYDE